MTEDQAKVCQALASCQESFFSSDAEQRIAREHGEDIAKWARQIYDDTIGCPVDWSKAGMDEGLSVLAEVCHDKYPWLTEEARLMLVHRFIMAWK